MANHAFNAGNESRLAPRIAWVLAVKALGLAVIWLLFVRGKAVPVDAQRTAAAFGMNTATPDSNFTSKGSLDGQ
jgi:hypothetical protein